MSWLNYSGMYLYGNNDLHLFIISVLLAIEVRIFEYLMYIYDYILQPVSCSADHCYGSIMDQAVKGNTPRPKEEVLDQAKDFIDQYYVSIKR